MSSRSEVSIWDRKTGTYVSAFLIDGISEQEVATAEKTWRPVFEEAALRMEAERRPKDRRPQHAHWDWRKKYHATADLLIYQMLGIEKEGDMQGLMLVQTGNKFCRLEEQRGKGLVYVLFLATAPWNSPEVVENPRYGQIGTVFLSAATQISLELGFSGRIGLHSLPQTEAWYARCNMTDMGYDPDPKHKNLKYFEMTTDQAKEFLS